MGDSLQPKSQLEVSGDVLIRQEAEDYINASGIELESSNDVGGGLNIGYLDPGDQLTYELSSEDALEPGAYALAFRHASQIDGGRFLVRAPERDEILGSVTVPNTGGWQNWETSSIMVQITARTERLELVAETGGWNLNWFEIYAADSVTLAEGLLSIADYETIEGTYADGEAYTLTRPLYTFGQVTPEHYSVRVAPQLIGLGLLEAVPADYLASWLIPATRMVMGSRVSSVSSLREQKLAKTSSAALVIGRHSPVLPIKSPSHSIETWVLHLTSFRSSMVKATHGRAVNGSTRKHSS